MLEKHKKQIILLVIAFLFFMGVGIYAGIRIGQRQSAVGKEYAVQIPAEDEGQVHADPNAVSIDQAYLDSLNERADILEEHPLADTQTIKYHLFTDAWFRAGEMEQKLPIWNDPWNELSFRVLGWIPEDMPAGQDMRMTDAFIKTGTVAPGQMLRKVNLSKSLATGTYDAIFLYTPIDNAETEYSTLEVHITIHVQ